MTWLVVFVLVVAVLLGLLVVAKRRAAGARLGGPSLVLLCVEPRALDQQGLRHAVERAYGVTLPGGDDAQEFVVGENPFMLKVAGYTMLVTCGPNPVVDDPEAFAAKLEDPTLRRLFGEHRAVLSFLGLDAPTADERVRYAHLAKLVAELLEGASLLYVEQRRGLVEVTDGLAARLRADDVTTALAEAFAPATTRPAGD
jgi:hypothetical protein